MSKTSAQAVALDRRAALGSLAAAGALLLAPRARAKGFDADLPALPVLDGGADPVFAAIERHKAAASAADAYDGDDETIYVPLDDAERDAMFALADTVPTTHAGAHAALRYLVKEAGDRHYRVLGIFGASLIEAKWGSFRPEA